MIPPLPSAALTGEANQVVESVATLAPREGYTLTSVTYPGAVTQTFQEYVPTPETERLVAENVRQVRSQELLREPIY